MIAEVTLDNVENGGNAPAAGQCTVTYNNDPLNRTSMIDNGTETVYGPPSGVNQYTSVTGHTLAYDANFNLSGYDAWSYVYDADKRLISASGSGTAMGQGHSAQFVYDGLGRCVKRTIGGVATIILYDDWKPIAEWDGWTEEYFQAWNVYGPGADEILLRHEANMGYVRYHSDANGNMTFLLDNDGAVVEKYTYDVFGRPKIMAPGGEVRTFSHWNNRFLFQGREYIGEIGVYDYRNRFYHPEIGRFLQVDPTGFDAGDMNLFRYVGDDPINGSDPTGLEEGADLVQLSIRATLSAAKAYRTNNPEGLGKAVWGAHRIDGGGYDEFPATAVIKEGYRYFGSVRRWVGYEQEATPPVDTKKYDYWAYVGHVHGRKGEQKFSRHDGDRARERVVVTRADAGDIDKRGNLKPGRSVKRAIPLKDGGTDSRNVYTEPSSSNTSSAPSAADIDARHQATGVPSQGAESVNFARGPR